MLQSFHKAASSHFEVIVDDLRWPRSYSWRQSGERTMPRTTISKTTRPTRPTRSTGDEEGEEGEDKEDRTTLRGSVFIKQ